MARSSADWEWLICRVASALVRPSWAGDWRHGSVSLSAPTFGARIRRKQTTWDGRQGGRAIASVCHQRPLNSPRAKWALACEHMGNSRASDCLSPPLLQRVWADRRRASQLTACSVSGLLNDTMDAGKAKPMRYGGTTAATVTSLSPPRALRSLRLLELVC